MKKIIIAFLVSMVAVTLFTVAITQEQAEFKGSLIEQVNTTRALYDLGGLTEKQDLNDIAQAKCNNMIKRSYLDHKNPEGLYAWDQYQFNSLIVGENIAWGMNNAQTVVRAWENSPAHKANLINAQFTEVGHATCLGDDGFIIVQEFRGF